MTRPTIWHIDPAQFTPYYNMAVCEALAEAGCDVRYIASPYIYDEALQPPRHFTTDYVYFRGLNRPWLADRPYIRRGLRALSYPLGHLDVLRQSKRQQPDVIHIQWSRLPSVDRHWIRRLKSQGRPIVQTVHDLVPLYALESDTAPLAEIYSMADRLILHTEANVRDFRELYPQIPPDRLRLVPMIAFNRHLSDSSQTQARARETLNLPQDAIIALFFGSIRTYKGIDILLDAFAQVQDDLPELHLLIAGKVDPLHREQIPALDALGDQPRVHLHDRYIPDDEMWAYYTAADLVIHPYRHITQSAALITAMSFGNAVVVSEVGGMPETIDGNGWIFPSEDVDALAAILRDAAADRARLQAMGERSQQLINERHAPSIVGERLLAVYQELIAP